MAKSRRQIIEEMVLAALPKIEKAFLESILTVKNDAIVSEVIDSLRRGDIDRAVDAVSLDSAAFAVLQDSVSDTFNTAGTTFTQALPKRSTVTGQQMIVRWDGRNPRAESILSEIAGELITGDLVPSQLELIRQEMTRGMMEGRNPRSIALDLVGRIDPSTGRRTGGIIGLSDPQAQWVRNARLELTQGDYTSYMTRERRDRSLDRIIRRAEKESRPLTDAEVEQMLGRYTDRLLQLRGETIGRTEAMRAIQAAQDESMRQAVEKGLVRKQDVKRIWRTASDSKVRETHAEMSGQTVGLDEAFVSPSGAKLMYPGDPNAPPGETINCRCVVENKIDFLGALADAERGTP